MVDDDDEHAITGELSAQSTLSHLLRRKSMREDHGLQLLCTVFEHLGQGRLILDWDCREAKAPEIVLDHVRRL